MLTHRGTSLLEAGQVMLLGSREAVEVRTESQWARFEWQLRPTILRSPVFAECFERPLPLQTLGSRMLMFTANAMLNQPVEESERAFGHYSLAAEQLVAGGLPIAGVHSATVSPPISSARCGSSAATLTSRISP